MTEPAEAVPEVNPENEEVLAFKISELKLEEIKYVNFIEPEAKLIAALTESGFIFILNTDGIVVERLNLKFKVESFRAHPLLPLLAIGTDQGCVVFVDIKSIHKPRVVSRTYLSTVPDSAITHLEFVGRGKLLVSGDQKNKRLFLQYGAPTMNFEYLDYDNLPSKIWRINSPVHHKDYRVQVLFKGDEDIVPFLLNNYNLGGERLDLVSSQAFEIPVTAFDYSSHKKLFYGFSMETAKIGCYHYIEDVQAAGVRDADLLFNAEFQLDVNKIITIGDRSLITLGEDGLIIGFDLPVKNEGEEGKILKKTFEINTHEANEGGISDGVICSNGTQIITFGENKTFIYVLINPVKESILDWGTLGMGKDKMDVTVSQKEILHKMEFTGKISVQKNEKTVCEVEDEFIEEFRVSKYKKESFLVQAGFAQLQKEMKDLLKFNFSRRKADQIEMDEFELDSEDEEAEETAAQNEILRMQIELKAINEEREAWCSKMKELTYDRYDIKGELIKSFNTNLDVSNYPLIKMTEESLREIQDTRQERRFIMKVELNEENFRKLGKELTTNAIAEMKKAETLTSLLSFDQQQDIREKLDILAGDKADVMQDFYGDDEEDDYYEGGCSPSLEGEDEEEEDGELDLYIDKNGEKIELGETNKKAKESIPVDQGWDDGDEEADDYEDTSNSEDEDGETGERRSKKRTAKKDELDSEEEDDEEMDAEDDNNIAALNRLYVSSFANDVKKKLIYTKNLFHGSKSYDLIETDRFLIDQMDVSTRQQVNMQIVLLKDEIRRLKVKFNEEFYSVKRTKLEEIKLSLDRNVRMRDIISYLEVFLDIQDTKIDPDEDPEFPFKVSDEEIGIEKYLTEKEKAEREAARLLEEQRRREKALKDDFRERALVRMMDGVIERRTEDILKVDIPMPEFMKYRREWDWTHEEAKLAEVYYAKVKELAIKRENFQKEFETELKHLWAINRAIRSKIDSKIYNLYDLKMKTEMSVRQEELKILRFIKCLISRQILDDGEKILTDGLESLQKNLKDAQNASSDLHARVDVCAKRYDRVITIEKSMERGFKKYLGEVGHAFESYLKLYKKRPKIDLKSERSPEVNRMLIQAMRSNNLKGFANSNGEEERNTAMSIMELEDPMQIPVGSSRTVWQKFCNLRREKMICELEAKTIGVELVHLKRDFTDAKAHEDSVEKDHNALLQLISTQRDTKMLAVKNFELQMVVPQEIIEIPDKEIASDFVDAILIKKSLIEACNAQIRGYGADKVIALTESKHQHTQILKIEWLYKVALQNLADAKEKICDIASQKVTKEVLEFLKYDANFKNMQQNRLSKINALHELTEKFHEKYMTDQVQILKFVKALVWKSNKRNKKMEDIIKDSNVQMNVHRLKCKVEDFEIGEKEAMRIELIMESSNLMRRIAQSAEEVYMLENELDRLYRKTYPVL